MSSDRASPVRRCYVPRSKIETRAREGAAPTNRSPAVNTNSNPGARRLIRLLPFVFSEAHMLHRPLARTLAIATFPAGIARHVSVRPTRTSARVTTSQSSLSSGVASADDRDYNTWRSLKQALTTESAHTDTLAPIQSSNDISIRG